MRPDLKVYLVAARCDQRTQGLLDLRQTKDLCCCLPRWSSERHLHSLLCPRRWPGGSTAGRPPTMYPPMFEEESYLFVELRMGQGTDITLIDSQNPFTCLLELVLYLSVGYLIVAKVIRAVLRRLSVTQHTRDRCTEATLLGFSSAMCLLLSWTELRPSRDVYRRENSLLGVLAHNRLFDENLLDSTQGRAVFAFTSALLLHAAGVTWYNQGLDLHVLKKTAYFVFYVNTRNLRFRCLGSAATLIVSLTELLLQLTRLVCCIERKRPYRSPVLTYLSLSTYVIAWATVFLGVFPPFFLQPCLRLDLPLHRMPHMCFLCGSLFLFYVIELATMPLIGVLRLWLLPVRSLVLAGKLERVLIPPPAHVLRELRELQAMKERSRAAREEFDRRHGLCKQARNIYKSLKMIMAVKRRIRNLRRTKLSADSEELPVSTASDASDDLHGSTADTASETSLNWSSTSKDTASEMPRLEDEVLCHSNDTGGEFQPAPPTPHVEYHDEGESPLRSNEESPGLDTTLTQ